MRSGIQTNTKVIYAFIWKVTFFPVGINGTEIKVRTFAVR
jgi:hypothetical protein